MALVKLSGQIIDIHGRFGGVYFKRGSDGTHIQAMPRVIKYQRIGAQLAGVNAWTGMSALWSLALISFFGALWLAYAAAHLFMSKDGGQKQITSYNWYMHYAMMFPEADKLPFWKPPHDPGDLPHYISTCGQQWMYQHIPAEWPVWLAGGYYWPGMDWNNAPSFRTDDYEWFIWWKDPVWVVSKSLGWEPEKTTYYSPDGEIEGWYKNPTTNRYTHIYNGGHGR